MSAEARIAALEREVRALQRQLVRITALGRSTLDPVDTGGVQLIQTQIDALSLRDGVPMLYHYGYTASPPIGADLHLSFVDGNRGKAVVVASNHQAHRLTGLGVGDAALYDSRGASIWLTAAGTVLTPAGKPVLVQGDLHVVGQVIQGYGTGAQVGLSTHRHGTTGSIASGTTTPTPGL